MKTPRSHLAVLVAVLLGTSALSAQDQLVLQALKKIESAEADLATMANGDVKAANQILADLKWANKRLNAAYKKDTSHWKDAARRLAAADTAVRAKAGATPAPAGQPPAKESGGTPPASGTGAGTKPAAGAAAGPVIGEQFEKLQQLNKEVNNGYQNLQLLNKTFMGDAYRVGSTTKEITKLKRRLAEFPSGDKNVQIAASNLKNFEDLFTKWQAEYKADNEASGDITAKLDALSEKYASQNLPGQMHWPFEREKLTTWASVTRKLLDEIPADVASIEGATNNAMVGAKVKNLVRWIGRSIPDRLNEQVTQVQSQCNGAVENSLRTAKGLRDIKPDDHNAIVNRVLADGALDRSMASLQEGLEAVDMAATLDVCLKVEDAPDRTAQRQEIEATITTLRELAKLALADVRMPKAVGVKAETMAKLTKIAEETLAKEKYEVNEIQQLVVTSDLQRKEKQEGTLRGTTTGATLTSYHYVWDEYRVVTAEKIGDEVWIFYNTLKFYHSSDSVTPQDVWILSRRFQSTQILAANLKKK